MKKAHRLILIALVLALILILLVVNSVSLFHAEYYIFADIHDFPSIMEESPEDITINQYDSPEKDKYLKKLPYNDFFAADVSGKDYKFQIYAYEFESAESAGKYFENATGKKSEWDKNFLESGGLTGSKIIVLDDTRVYRVSTSSPRKTRAFLAQIFPIRIK